METVYENKTDPEVLIEYYSYEDEGYQNRMGKEDHKYKVHSDDYGRSTKLENENVENETQNTYRKETRTDETD